MPIKIKKPDPIPFTKDAYEEMQRDFERLSVEREEILVRLQTAREQGDLSENGAYKYAKFELGNVNRQLRRLTHLLRYGVITQSRNQGVVEFGSTVTLESNGKKLTFTLVSEHESNPAKQKLSFKSPIGQAIIGKKVGDNVKVQTPAGETIYTLLTIL